MECRCHGDPAACCLRCHIKITQIRLSPIFSYLLSSSYLPRNEVTCPRVTARTRAAKRGKSLRQLKKFLETDTLIWLKGRGVAEQGRAYIGGRSPNGTARYLLISTKATNESSTSPSEKY